jgi:hypothetical protein
MHGGNIHAKGIVTITSSSVIHNDPRHLPDNLLDSNIQQVLTSKNEPTQWIQFDFHIIPVSAIHYLIQSQSFPRGNGHLKSWVLEGSIDRLNWAELHRQMYDDKLNGPNAAYCFSILNPIECLLIRLRQTRKNHVDGHVFALCRFELFGRLL